MVEWSEEMIQETIRVWKPDADKVGEKITREDAIEILNNMTNLAELLIEMYQKDKKDALQATKEPL